MLFSAPISFRDALDSRAVRSILATERSSIEMSEIGAELRERAMFSARTTHAGYLQDINDQISKLVDGKSDPATVRLQLKQSLDAIGYQPDPDDRGTIKDLSSDSRLNLIIETNTKMAQGYGGWVQGQDPALLDQWPAQELFRMESRQEPRNWIERWRGAGGRIFAGGRMIALKNDPIWIEISAFGLPYPPFDFGSGMDVRDIDRNEAMRLGLIDRDTLIPPVTRGFNADLKVSAPVREARLRAALESEGYQFDGDILRSN